MTIPSDFNDQSKVVGETNINHPIYTFRVNLDINASEAVGPNTNQRSVTLLHPDVCQSDIATGRAQRTTRALQRMTWFPMLSQAGNVEINDDGTITVYGIEGKRLIDTYTTGTNPLLTLTNSAPYTSA